MLLAGSSFTLPQIPPLVFVLSFSISLGYIYATIYAVGRLDVTTTQEAGSCIALVILRMVSISRSSYSHPNFAPRVRFMSFLAPSRGGPDWTETPHSAILLSFVIGIAPWGLMVASRIYASPFDVRQESYHPEVMLVRQA